jgi:pimeloyl-[acyl-carrier protein] methyl ester esterase
MTVDEIREKAEASFRDKKNLIVVGWSMGSIIALETAEHYSKKIVAMFLISSTPQFVRQGEKEIGIDPRQLAWMKKRITRSPENGLNDFDQQMFSSIEKQAGWDRKWKSWVRNRIPSPSSLLAGLQYLQEFRLSPKYKNFSFPTFLLSGDKDVICPPSGAISLAHTLPFAKLEIWQDAGHLPFWTFPQDFHLWLKAGIQIALKKRTDQKTI